LSAQEYGCNYCKITFRKPETANPKDKVNVKCPSCGSNDVEKFHNLADKLRFFSSLAFSGG
jgi:DNA-directed RNA polymerase subunit RPC12/RpoP